MNWIAVSNWYYRLFKALTIYNGSPPLFSFWHESDWVQLRKHIHELPSWSANMKMRNVETITHKFLSKTLYKKRRKCQAFLRVGFRLKDFPRYIFTVFGYQSIKITWFLTILSISIFTHWLLGVVRVLQDVTAPGSIHPRYFERVVDLKNWTPTTAWPILAIRRRF